ncbi:RNA methyltransferase [Myroides phaeus]|uniref:TrmH family RNA methyltransferase n=1 Tax=Myroides phaeus TaxID=702745 RepID=UPI002DB558F1|nr:RNA methyltransferase [Myroides phaeus]MEC4116764.1 RNA methyltransferase [Myroides phaeus]
MVTKNQIKLIKSLHQKKYRKEHQLFIAEGVKVIGELLKSSLVLEHIYCTEELNFEVSSSMVSLVSKDDMKKMSALTTNSNCLAVFHCAKEEEVDYNDIVVALDNIRDPGNLGTIIRLCDWFGIRHIICTSETVDVYNPKVVQATMGSMVRVNLVYGDLEQMIKNAADVSVYGTFMDGDSIYKQEFVNKGIIVMGNEANGISKTIESLVTQKIAIPRFGSLQQTESLNVAMAASIVINEFRRINF